MEKVRRSLDVIAPKMCVRSAAEPVAIVLTDNRQTINFNLARILDFSIPLDHDTLRTRTNRRQSKFDSIKNSLKSSRFNPLKSPSKKSSKTGYETYNPKERSPAYGF